MTELLKELTPLGLEVIGLILMSLLSMLALKLQKFAGVKIEEKHMKTLHSAVMSGVRAVLRDGEINKRDKKIVINHVKRYVNKSAPDAIAALVKDESILDELILGALGQAIPKILD